MIRSSKHLLHEGEREIPRPQDPDAQQTHYSGKKKNHTIKHALVVNSLCLVLFVSATVTGKTHDKKLADTHYSIPERLYPLARYRLSRLPSRRRNHSATDEKAACKELTAQQKQTNRIVSAFVRIEHAIGSIKRYRILKDECRLRKNQFTHKIFLTCAALHNFRLRFHPFHYEVTYSAL